jgi:P4 family phage/plasmid primase-like protien
MGDKDLNIFGGSYHIPDEDLDTFYALYYDKVFVQKKNEYLTERQRPSGGPLAIDFDFRYGADVSARQHTEEHIEDMVFDTLDLLKELLVFRPEEAFSVYVFEKPNINLSEIESKGYVKDGIHMIIGISSDVVMNQVIRKNMIERMPNIWSDLPLTNDWESVLDEGIAKGANAWTLYGSKKPANEAYRLTYQYHIHNYNESGDGEFSFDTDKKNQETIDTWKALSVRHNLGKLPKFEASASGKKQCNVFTGTTRIRTRTRTTKTRTRTKKQDADADGDADGDADEDGYGDADGDADADGYGDEGVGAARRRDEEIIIPLRDIVNSEVLERAVQQMVSRFDMIREYDIQETHLFTQALPANYYEPGSHLLNRMVAFALKHTDDRLFLSWVQLRSRASDFDYEDIPNLWEEWRTMPLGNSVGNCVTRRSILYWCKKDNPEEYDRIRKQTINYFIVESIKSGAEYDIAMVLANIYKDTYVCVSYANKGLWYRFDRHHWVEDKGLSLRNAISVKLDPLYDTKLQEVSAGLFQAGGDDKKVEQIKEKIKRICETKLKLKKTADKNNILREAAEILFDADFVRKMDTNKYLLCFNNGVVDFTPPPEEKDGGGGGGEQHTIVFREGYPEDYITKCTKIDYRQNYKAEEEKELIDIMAQLFPIPDLNRYMWDHLASCLIGSNMNQLLNIYHGSGGNGKSILADLMSWALGDYKGMIPITLVTDQRGKIGGTSSEVLQLKGVRYAVMQEPSKGMKLNEGVMKELTGGDPIQARGLYHESETFVLQANIVVCTNNLFDIESNDDGTWRRIRKVTFPSKFVDEGENYNEETPYVFPKDKTLKDKLPRLAVIFASMLVKRAFATGGVVLDCETVLKASNAYRNGQDHLSAFLQERIMKTGVKTDRVGKRMLYEEFKVWFTQEQGSNRKIPKGEELNEVMTRRFGSASRQGWIGVKIVHPEEEEEVQ